MEPPDHDQDDEEPTGGGGDSNVIKFPGDLTRLKARAGTLSEQDIQYFSQFCG